MDKEIKKTLDNYFSTRVKKYGANVDGVDWNSETSQILRFKQLLKICEQETDYTINDLGCGYGALYQYLKENNLKFRHYYGYDISQDMIISAKEMYGSENDCDFLCNDCLKKADFTVASGTFNMKFDFSNEAWEKHTLQTLQKIDEASIKGFAFNILTSYSDQEYMRSDLYYADPTYYFNYCKTNFSRNVALLHDYDLYEFTILVKK